MHTWLKLYTELLSELCEALIQVDHRFYVKRMRICYVMARKRYLVYVIEISELRSDLYRRQARTTSTCEHDFEPKGRTDIVEICVCIACARYRPIYLKWDIWIRKTGAKGWRRPPAIWNSSRALKLSFSLFLCRNGSYKVGASVLIQ
jgi:hypothetical protein